jgi:N-methylhydantoinase B/oxoprolinase/acetone carboxylase alpha subunit
MQSPFRQLGIRTLGVLTAGAFLGLIGGAGEAQTVDQCFSTCLGRNQTQAACSRYCNIYFGQKKSAGPRVYGYSNRRAGGCGAYHYLKGGKCVDARVTPPR